MSNTLTKYGAVCVTLGMALLSTGCTTAAVGVGAASAMVQAAVGNSPAKESQRRADMQAEIQAQDDAKTPVNVESEWAYLNVVEQMQKKGLWFASLAHIDALEARWKPSIHSKLLRADALRNTSQAAASEVLYKQLLNSSVAPRALHGLGLLAASQGQFDAAVAHLQIAQKSLPTDSLLLNDLGYALLHTQRGSEAGLPLKKANQLDAKNVRIQSNLALYLVLFGQEKEALAWMAQTDMPKEQRLRILQQAQQLGLQAQVMPAPIQALGVVPVVQVDEPVNDASPLIFEKQLSLSAPPSNPARVGG
jgi:Flp pilus assembly protein TadD